MKNFLLILFLGWFFLGCKQTNKTKEPVKIPAFTSVTAAILSEVSYCTHTQDTLSKYLPTWKITWNPVPVNGNYAFLATDGYNYALAIRGSLLKMSWDAFNNWIYQDLNVVNQQDWNFTDSIPGAKVSQGAYEGWNNLNKLKDSLTGKSLLQVLDSTVTHSSPLFITGHSLGGNLATIYASWLYSHYKKNGQVKNNINVITYAAPAAGNAFFATDFNKKFPNAMRYENSNDMVPKFPVADKVGELGNLFSPAPAATAITVAYKFVAVKLSFIFTTVKIALKGLELKNSNSVFTQPGGAGQLLTVPLSGKNNGQAVTNWFAEAGYQHSMEQYAAAVGAPVIKTD